MFESERVRENKLEGNIFKKKVRNRESSNASLLITKIEFILSDAC